MKINGFRKESRMKSYQQMSKEELMECKASLEKAFEEAKAKGLKLDMSRGKPAAMQLDLVMPIMDVLTSKSDLTSRDGMDCRNYGGPDGLPEAKELMAAMIDVRPEQVVVCGNSVACYSSRGNKEKFSFMEQHMTKILSSNDIFGVKVRIFHEKKAYADRIRSLNENPQPARNNLKYRVNEQYPDLSGDELIWETLKSIAI